MSKLEVMRHLVLSGWEALDDGPPLLHRGQRFCLSSNLLRSHMYWVCMAHSSTIFAKPGDLDAISHHMSENYYRCLVQLPDLAALLALEDLYNLPDGRFRELLKNNGKQPLVALEDGMVGEDGALLAIEDGFVEEVGVVPVVALKPEAPVTLTMEGFPTVKVLFDASTGVWRGLVECPQHSGPGLRCRKYVTLHNYASKAHCCAYLISWKLEGCAHIADDSPDGKDEHILRFEPSQGFVDSVYGKLLT